MNKDNHDDGQNRNRGINVGAGALISVFAVPVMPDGRYYQDFPVLL